MKRFGIILIFNVLLVSCSGGGFREPPFVDTFDRADNTNLGTDWLEDAGNPAFQISGNRLQAFGGFGFASYKTPLNLNDVTAIVGVRISGGTATALQTHIIGRAQAPNDIDNTYSCVVITGFLRIYKIVLAASTLMVSGTQPVPNSDGTAYELKFRIHGSSLTCSISGAVTDSITATDTTFGPGGYFGLASAASGNTVFMDDFQIGSF